MKRSADSLRDLWKNIKHSNFRIIEVPEEEQKKKGCEKIFEEIIVENFPQHGKESSQSSPRGTKSPIQGKHKKKHTKWYTNQPNKDQTQKKEY